MASLLYRIGRASARRAWLFIGAWVVILGLSVGSFLLFGGTLISQVTIPGTATEAVQKQLSEQFSVASGGSGSVVFATFNGQPFTTAQKADIKTALASSERVKGVKGYVDPFVTTAQLADRQQELANGQAKVATARTQLRAGQTQLDAAQKKIDDGRTQIAGALAEAEAAGQSPAAKAQLDEQSATLDAAQGEVAARQAALTTNKATLEKQAATLADGSTILTLAKDIQQVSSDGSVATGTVRFAAATSDVPKDIKAAVVERIREHPVAGVHTEFSSSLSQTPTELFGPGEIIGLLIAAATLLVMLGTLIAAGLPILNAIIGVGVGITASLALSGVVDMLSVTPILGVMLGLAVGIDYSLFILNRHRNQLRRGIELHESIGLANGTSGNAVVFAGTTVIIALLALNVTGIPFLGLMGTVGAICVAAAILIAVTLTPALLSLVGLRLLPKKARATLRRPVPPVRVDAAKAPAPVMPMKTSRAIITVVAGLVALAIVALPTLSMRLGLPDGSSEPTSSTQYKAFKLTTSAFGAGFNGPMVVVATLPQPVSAEDLTHQEAVLATQISTIDHVRAVAPIGASKNSQLIAFQVVPTQGPTAASTETLVHDFRDATLKGGVTLGVAGTASANIDISEKIGGVLPLYLIVVIGLSLLILILVFRSILVPLTATVGFLLSLLAAFGGLTAVFQWGWFSAVTGVHDPGPVLSFLPILLVGILFGLAMDYQLFLVSGMREVYAHGAPARIAVQRGVHAGRTVVIAAALIMIAVFGGFLFSNSVIIESLGFGLAFGVLIDAFIVRLLLIPAAMHLLGDAAWWLPKWLDKILPNVDVEGAGLEVHYLHQTENTSVENELSDSIPR